MLIISIYATYCIYFLFIKFDPKLFYFSLLVVCNLVSQYLPRCRQELLLEVEGRGRLLSQTASCLLHSRARGLMFWRWRPLVHLVLNICRNLRASGRTHRNKWKKSLVPNNHILASIISDIQSTSFHKCLKENGLYFSENSIVYL